MGAELGPQALLSGAGPGWPPACAALQGLGLVPGGPCPPHGRFRGGAARSSGSPSAADTGSVLCSCCRCHTCLFFFLNKALYFWRRCVFMAVRARAFR